MNIETIIWLGMLLVSVVMAWGLSRAMDFAAGINFRDDIIPELRSGNLALAVYLAARWLGLCFLAGYMCSRWIPTGIQGGF